MRGHHLMEGGDAVPRSEFGYILANLMDDASDIIALVDCLWGHLCALTHTSVGLGEGAGADACILSNLLDCILTR